MTERLYLEDLQVGQRFACGQHALDAEQIKAFAREFDPQPFHLDEEAARATFFGGLAASGWHIVCLTMRMIAEKVPFAGGLIGGAAEITWPQPTRPTDILEVDQHRDGSDALALQAGTRHGPAAHRNPQPEGRAAADLHRQMRRPAPPEGTLAPVLTGDSRFCHLPALRLQGGAEIPTGGRVQGPKRPAPSPRAPRNACSAGQQTRSNAWADGHSPDERRRAPARCHAPRVADRVRAILPWNVFRN